MGILIDDRQKRHKISKIKLQKKAQAILNALGSHEGELSILLVDDSEIKTLNKDYLSRSGPTNVIAFPMKEGDFSDINPQLLGDVVISMETAGREALQSGISTEERFAQLLVHGILHLFGFDHEKSEQDARKMEKKSDELLKLIESY
ncbi:MAG: rRNA maturation RNase YbeY [Deltaproteobacteria bacterium]|nr:rRNA maturation RNase YbeY [Deltaproteobacteria bacterium]